MAEPVPVSDGEIRAAAQSVVVAAEGAFAREFPFFSGDQGFFAGAREWLEYVPPLFEWFTARSGDRLTRMVGYLEQVRMTLTDPVPTNLNSVMTEVQDWEGRAADAFDLEFLSPFSEVVRNQVDLTNQVLTGLLAEKAIIEAARFDAKTVAETTAETLRTLDFDDGPSGWQVALTVVGAVGVIGGTLGSGGLGWALLEVGAAVGPLFVDGPKGDTTVDVLVAMDSAVRTIRAEMTAQEELLAGALNRDVDTVQQYLKSHLLPARPLTTANVGGQLGEFRPPMESMI